MIPALLFLPHILVHVLGENSFESTGATYIKVQTSNATLSRVSALFHKRIAGVKLRMVCSDLCDVTANCNLWTMTSTDCALGSTGAENNSVVSTTELRSLYDAPGEFYGVAYLTY